MHTAPQQPVRELDHRVAEIHNRVARERFDVDPLALPVSVFSLLPVTNRPNSPREQNLQPPQAIKQQRQTPEIRMRPKRDATVALGLRRRLDEAHLVTRERGEAVQVGQVGWGGRGKEEVGAEAGEEEGQDGVG